MEEYPSCFSDFMAADSSGWSLFKDHSVFYGNGIVKQFADITQAFEDALLGDYVQLTTEQSPIHNAHEV